MNSNNFIWLVFSLSFSPSIRLSHDFSTLALITNISNVSISIFQLSSHFQSEFVTLIFTKTSSPMGRNTATPFEWSALNWIFFHPSKYVHKYNSKKNIVVSEIRLLDHMVFNRKTLIPNIKKTKAKRHSYANCLRKNHTGLVRRRSHTVVEISIWLANFV